MSESEEYISFCFRHSNNQLYIVPRVKEIEIGVIQVIIMALVQDPPTVPVQTDLKVPTTVASVSVETPKSETQTQPLVNGTESKTKPKFEIEEHPIDQVRDVKVAVIGAGLAGVSAGVLLPAKLPGIDLTIYDKNADVVSDPQGQSCN